MAVTPAQALRSLRPAFNAWSANLARPISAHERARVALAFIRENRDRSLWDSEATDAAALLRRIAAKIGAPQGAIPESEFVVNGAA